MREGLVHGAAGVASGPPWAQEGNVRRWANVLEHRARRIAPRTGRAARRGVICRNGPHQGSWHTPWRGAKASKWREDSSEQF